MQRLRRLFDDDSGVSPVIGVILMVAITVILAAVIATFVMNMGPTETTMPTANFDFEETSTSGTYDLIHDGGEAVSSDNIVASASGTTVSAYIPSGSSTEYTASDVVVENVGSGAGTITITWQNPDSDESQILFEEEVPS